jgi:protein-S-isoprenylcysteine O-methyltransferase
MAFAFSEYFIEWYFFPWLKGNWIVYCVAFVVAAIGQVIRTTAMYTAGVSFHHMVQVRQFPFYYIFASEI